MKKIGLAIIGFSFTLFGFGQTLDWANSSGGASFDYGYGITVDGSGNVYTIGQYSNATNDFDPGAGTFSLTSAGSYDIFVQKLDASGNFVWAKSVGGAGWDESYSIGLNASGNLYITGSFEGTADFDPGAGISNLTSAGMADIFVLKLDANGNFIWAKSFGGTGFDNGYSISIDAVGNAYTTGFFAGTADFDPGAGTFNLTSAGGNDVFVQKLDASGNFIWARSFGGTGADEARAISTVANSTTTTVTGNGLSATGTNNPGNTTGAILSAGTPLDGTNSGLLRNTFPSATITLEHTVPAGTVITIAISDVNGSGHVSIDDGGAASTTYQPGVAGNSQYITLTTGQSTNQINFTWLAGRARVDGVQYSITTTSTTDIYTTGHFYNTVDFDPGGGTNNHTSAGGYDVFVQKLDANGNFVWAKSAGGTADDFGYANAIDASGNVHSAGAFRNTVDFDPGGGTTILTSLGSTDIFVQKLDASGNLLWANSSGGADSDQGLAITLDGSGNIYTTGDFRATADFDPGGGSYPLTSIGDGDVFIQALDASGNFLCAVSFGGTSGDAGNSISVDGSGNVHTTGNYQNTVDFDPYAGTFPLTSSGSQELFVQKLSLGCVVSVLSIELTEFELECDGNEVLVTWTTETETNNDYFTIERSHDGQNIEPITIVKGAGTSTTLNSYSWIDKNPLPGTSYYRISDTDYDGISETHQWQSIECKEETKVLLKIVDFLGRETPFSPNTPLIYIYSDGTTEKVYIVEY
jgi:hypothetical protein